MATSAKWLFFVALFLSILWIAVVSIDMPAHYANGYDGTRFVPAREGKEVNWIAVAVLGGSIAALLITWLTLTTVHRLRK